MATLQRIQKHSALLAGARLGLVLVVAMSLATGCKKSGAAVEPVAGKKPPIVKAKKPGVDGKAKDGPDGVTETTAKAPAGPGVVSQRAPTPRPVVVADAPTPAAAPVPPPAAAPAPTPAPVVPVAVARGKPAELVARADAAKPELPKPEPVKPEPARPARVEPTKAEEAPLPPGAVAVHAVPTEAPLDVNGYVIAADLPKVLGTKQNFRRTELAGVTPTANYNAMFYAAEKIEQFGVAVQVWRDPNLAESRTRFNTMKNSYSNVTPSNKVTDMGFRSFYGAVVTQVFVDPRRPLLAAVSCSSKLCNADQLVELARRVAERLH